MSKNIGILDPDGKNDNPLKLFRLVDGNWTSEKI